MFSGRLLFAGHASLLVVADLVLFSANCHAAKNQHDGNNSCGDIRNISFPFRLKANADDNCGVRDFELACDENNRTVLYLYAGKYYVQAINYSSQSIRLVDAEIQRNNCSSLPLHSLTSRNFSYSNGPYEAWSNSLAVFLSCENPVNSPLYINTTASSSSCGQHGVVLLSSSSKRQYSYVMIPMFELDVAALCTLDMMVMTSDDLFSGPSDNRWNTSFSDVHNKLADGFELSWRSMRCKQAKRQKLCFDNNANITFSDCFDSGRTILAAVVHQLGFYWEEFLYHQYYWFLLRMVIGPILAARFLCAPCVFAFLIRKFRRRHLSMYDNVEGFLRSQNNLMPINYSYSNIRKMTKGFRDKLGEGGYGSVYKGKLRSGNLVAVKMLSKPKADGQEFINEVATIGRIHHISVVQLIGYCAERSKRALIYDFMPNGSLEKYIFSQEGNLSLSCEQMYKISLGVARGIEYLHRGCDMQILHFDIKPHNILLDENFTPKVSDFGLAKLYPTDDSIVSLTAARGTLGYMAPELFYKNIGGVSYKADIYSYGMLLMEIAGRRRNWNASADSSQIYFPSWVYDQFTEGRNVEMGESTEEEKEMVKKMMVVALWCIQMKPSDRPSMNKVVEMLEGNIENIQTPPKPFLYPQQTNPTMFPNNLSGACLDSITVDISAR